jgi:hypothetical protein
MAYDGIQFGQRVDGFTERKLHAKVVDNILNAPTYFSRIVSAGKPFLGKTEDVTVDIVSDTQGEFYTGLETLNSSAANTTITLSYAHTAFTQPEVSIMLESFANAGETGTISLEAFKYAKAAAETLQRFGSAIYADGTANRPNGLGNIVLDSGTIGGQSRSTYSQLSATVTAASSNKLTLAQMATLHDTISAAGLSSEEPNIGVTTKTVWSLYEQLLTPNVRTSYNEAGYPALAVRGKYAMRNKSELKNAAGFSALSYRGMPIIKDDFCTSGYLYFLNENYFDWMGRTIVPDNFKDFITKVNLGTNKSYEGTGAEALDMPSDYNGFFYQKPLMLPNQAGMIARFHVIGQLVGRGFRRQGVLTGVTSV